ncbi:malate synthase family protein [Mycobacterium xenopi 3993]|nr:malate synthase family protein [Mycobacterium xenopi 3993]
MIDPESPVGKTDRAGIKDVILESAVTTIIDFEDAVAAVDADDKTRAYRNWLGLNKGDLSAEVNKDGRTFTRVLNQDRHYTSPDGGELVLPGRALLFVRNVGHLMTNDAIVDSDGNAVFEGIQDALFTGLCAIHGLKASDANGRCSTAAPARFTSSSRRCTARRGRVHHRAVQPGRRRARAAAEDPQGRGHGRGAAHHREPQGLHQGRRRPDRVHQHRFPGPHWRRDPHLDGGRSDGAQRCHEDPAVDPGLRGQQRRRRPGHRFRRPRPDRQGHVDDDRADGRHGRAEDRSAPRRGQHRMGPLAHRRDPARVALPPGRRGGRSKGAGRPAAGHDRPAADHPAGQGISLGA